eukprot:8335162-Karenia_brevis.AAC.1
MVRTDKNVQGIGVRCTTARTWTTLELTFAIVTWCLEEEILDADFVMTARASPCRKDGRSSMTLITSTQK